MRARYRGATPLLVALLHAGPALAVPDRPTLADVMQALDTRLPQLRAVVVERDLARTDLLSAEGAFDPSWKTKAANRPLGYYRQTRLDSLLEQPTTLWGTTVFGGWRLGQGDFADYDGKLETNALGEFRAGLSVPLWRNGPIDRRRATIRRAAIGLDIAELTIKQQRIDLGRQAAQRYWDWVAAGHRVRLATELLALARQRDRDLQAAVRAGQIPAIEQVEQARSVAQRQAQLVVAQRGQQQAAIELSLYWREPDGTPVRPAATSPPALPDPPDPAVGALDEAVTVAQGQRPEMRRLHLQRDQAAVERSWAENQVAPGVDLGVAAAQDLGAGSPTRAPLDLEASIMVEVPLRTRTAAGRIANAEAAMARLEAQALLAGDRIRADVQDAHSAVSAAVERLAMARQEWTLATRVAEAERKRFFLGDGTLFVLNLREQAAFDAALRQIDALRDYHKAHAAYQAALGVDAAGSPP